MKILTFDDTEVLAEEPSVVIIDRYNNKWRLSDTDTKGGWSLELMFVQTSQGSTRPISMQPMSSNVIEVSPS